MNSRRGIHGTKELLSTIIKLVDSAVLGECVLDVKRSERLEERETRTWAVLVHLVERNVVETQLMKMDLNQLTLGNEKARKRR